jgi:hypothetical protein
MRAATPGGTVLWTAATPASILAAGQVSMGKESLVTLKERLKAHLTEEQVAYLTTIRIGGYLKPKPPRLIHLRRC